MTILDDIVEYKKQLLAEGYYDALLNGLEAVNVSHKPTVAEQFETDRTIGVIAEIKSKSPTVSDIPERNLEEQLRLYTAGGASAISILTDEHYFGGSYERMATLTKQTDVPVLCKDFMIDERQIDVAKKAGASMILLIVNILTDEALARLHDYATGLGLEVLVEVHDPQELARAHRIHPQFVGVNNRDLRSFKTDVSHTGQILTSQRQGIYYISESGIKTVADIETLVPTGIAGVLVGETLMKADDPQAQLQSFKLRKEV
ncbi:indole-3-glycerol phosphate synthase TrpC [Staphylococcus delphini]|uniref:indole-3-glycerol phosphate synthase TrpC n=1 Tax=Staphylococcus delphini TaxID=53344 RepID=UPI0021CF0484|nr:indole-3-glycerol phosphate synthase TrpC [Staphylococcus delphini]UXS22075.1 indole-3-glycerol phosphate synthase TrpC [Staphylococcus delphini]UXS58016.1 indole-3-glycerol phosphate synthase TrpC [Staphylococcus delphini]